MMRAIRVGFGILVLALMIPASAFAQAGTTPFLSIPETLARGESDFGGYVSIEDDIDLFGTYRRGFSPGFDAGLRAGFTDAGGGGVNLGIDGRYMLSHGSKDLPLNFALVANAQFSFMDVGTLLTIPFGVSLGAQLQPEGRPLWLYAIPYLSFEYFNPDAPGSSTDLDIGVELGGRLLLSGKLWLTTAVTIQDDVALALGLVFRD